MRVWRINLEAWKDLQDRPVGLEIYQNRLVPMIIERVSL